MFRGLTCLSRALLVIGLIVGLHDFIGYLMDPTEYPIGTEQGDSRYESGERFLWTAGIDAAVALVGVVLWAYFANQRDRRKAALASVATAVALVLEGHLRFLVFP